MISRFLRPTLMKYRSLSLTKRWFGGAPGKKDENFGQFASSVESLLSNPWFHRISSGVVARVVAGSVFVWCSSTLMMLSYADFMRYRRTVNSFYRKNGRIADTTIERKEDATAIAKAIANETAMSVIYGKDGAGKTFVVSNACDTINEPTVYIEIRNVRQFMEDLVDRIEYYQNEDLTLRNYFQWIIPRFSLARQEKEELTLNKVVRHLNKCEEWLERVQKYPWNRARGVYQGKLNIVLDSFDRLITLEEFASRDEIDASHKLGKELIEAGKMWNDLDSIRMNFVLSEGSLHDFASIASSGASKRMMKFIEIKEINEAKGVEFIKGYYQSNYKSTLSEKDVKNMYIASGGLFSDMRLMVDCKTIDSFKEAKYGSFLSDFVDLGIDISPGYKTITKEKKTVWKLLQAVAKVGEIERGAAMDMVGGDDTLLRKLSCKRGPLFLSFGAKYARYEFVSTPMKNFVNQVIADCNSLIN